MFEASVDRLGRAVRGAGPVEVGEHVGRSAYECTNWACDGLFEKVTGYLTCGPWEYSDFEKVCTNDGHQGWSPTSGCITCPAFFAYDNYSCRPFTNSEHNELCKYANNASFYTTTGGCITDCGLFKAYVADQYFCRDFNGDEMSLMCRLSSGGDYWNPDIGGCAKYEVPVVTPEPGPRVGDACDTALGAGRIASDWQCIPNFPDWTLEDVRNALNSNEPSFTQSLLLYQRHTSTEQYAVIAAWVRLATMQRELDAIFERHWYDCLGQPIGCGAAIALRQNLDFAFWSRSGGAGDLKTTVDNFLGGSSLLDFGSPSELAYSDLPGNIFWAYISHEHYSCAQLIIASRYFPSGGSDDKYGGDDTSVRIGCDMYQRFGRNATLAQATSFIVENRYRYNAPPGSGIGETKWQPR